MNLPPKATTFTLELENVPEDMKAIVPIAHPQLPSLGSVRAPVMLSQKAGPPPRVLKVKVTDEESHQTRILDLKFLAPQR